VLIVKGKCLCWLVGCLDGLGVWCDVNGWDGDRWIEIESESAFGSEKEECGKWDEQKRVRPRENWGQKRGSIGHSRVSPPFNSFPIGFVSIE
jgi:hypothetical protein